MGPYDVGKVAREVRIFRRGEPAREHFAATLAFDLRGIPAEELWSHRNAGHGMLHFAVGAIENHGFSRVISRFPPDLGKERGKAIIVIHGPSIERMVMALGALDAHAHENLRGILRQ